MSFTEKLKGWRTLSFNVLMGILALWRTLRPEDTLPADDMLEMLLNAIFASLESITVVGNVFLRFKTNTAIFKKA